VRTSRLQIRHKVLLFSLAYDLRKLVRYLEEVELGGFPKANIEKLVDRLAELHRGINDILRVAEEKGIIKLAFSRKTFGQIRQSAERIGDLLEGYYIYLDDEFRGMIQDAIKEIRPAENPTDWRSSLAKMQD